MTNINDPDYYSDHVPDEYPRLVDLLDQDEVWGRPSERVSLSGMDPEHVDNVVNWLILRADSLRLSCLEDYLSVPPPPIDTQAEVDYHSGFTTMTGQSAEEWLESTPLMVRLRELQAERINWEMSVRRINVDLCAGGQDTHFLLLNDHLWPTKVVYLVEADARVLADELNSWLATRGTGGADNDKG